MTIQIKHIIRAGNTDDGFEVHFEKSGFKTIKKALQCAIDRDFAKQNDIT